MFNVWRLPRGIGRNLLRHAMVAVAGAGLGTALAQNISDVPVAVKNNVAPNFMFMIDNSGSMSNIVPTSPYDPSATYLASCPSGNLVPAGTSVDLRIVTGGEPRLRYGGTNYRHISISGSGQRCFDNTATYGARLLADNNGSPSGYLDAEYTGHYLNWYFGAYSGAVTGWTDRKLVTTGSVQTRMEIAKASAKSVIDGLPLNIAGTSQPAVRVGLSTYNGGDGGSLLRGMSDLTTTHRTNVKSSIDGLTPSGNTPLAETLADIGRYMATGYSGNVSAGPVNNVPINDFLRQNGRQSCLSGANCATTTTDPVPAPATGTPGRPIQYWCQRSYAFMLTDGRPQGDQALSNNTYLRDYDGDCSGANAVNCTGSFDRKTAQQYESEGSDYLDDVAKALFDVDLRPNLQAPSGRTKKNNLLTYTIGFADLQVQNDPLIRRAATQGGGLFLYASDTTSLTGAFNEVMTDAFAKDAAAAAVAVANAQITLNNVGYASSYNSGSWYGDLEGYSIDTSTALQVPGPSIWSLQATLDAMSPSARKIASYDGTTGREFTAANFAGTPASLTAEVINFIRGDRSLEGVSQRRRQHVLGDIVNAEPLVVTYPGSVPIIFQGANDGMLHVVDARTDASVPTRGQELWAYVPRLVHGNLAQLASTSYTHKYFVDGTPAAAEITGAAPMSRILVGGLGKGGRGYYALDITSYQAANQADAAAKVKWEFTHANMGYSFGSPLIVRTSAGWRVLVTSGYDNGTASGGDGRGYVWVLDPATGAILSTIATGVGSTSSPSGLAHLSRLSNTTPDALVRYVYGGDLLGNVWRFDLDTAQAVQIAVVTDPGGTAQPITAPVEVGAVAGNAAKFNVFVGTGRYFADEDVPGVPGANTWATQRQSMYGIVDDTSVVSPSLPNIRGTNGGTCPAGGGNGDFVCQSLTYVPPTLPATIGTYTATTHAIGTKRGWYVDFPQDAQLSNGRVTGKPALTVKNTLAFTVNIPNSERCTPGGTSWFFALSGNTGGAVERIQGGNTYYDAGGFLGFALASRPVIVQTADGTRALICMSDKTVQNPLIPEPLTTAATWRRIYWRTVR